MPDSIAEAPRQNERDDLPAPKSFVIADISGEPARIVERFLPMADYLARRLDHGYTQGEVKVAPDPGTLAQWIKEDKIDLYMDSPFPAMLVKRAAKDLIRPVCLRWKYGVRTYRSVFFARKSSGIHTLEDLKGRSLAFEEPFSTSGYLLPAGFLIQNRHKLVHMERAGDAVPADSIGWCFADEDMNVIHWVLSGKVDAGVIHDPYFNNLSREVLDHLNLIAATPEVPRQIAMVRRSLGPEISAQVVSILSGMEADEEGRTILAGIKDTKRFEPVDTEALRQSLEYIENIYDAVNAHMVP